MGVAKNIMDHDEKILGYLAKDENISQRKLAKLTDLSLGHINLLLHKLVNKGFVKIEKVKPSNLRYILTPQGIARNTKRTYCFIRNAVKHALMLKGELEQIFEDYDVDGYTVYLDGEEDEIYQIVKQVKSEKKQPNIQWVKDIDELINADKKIVIVVWQSEKEEIYKQRGIKYINLLSRINSL
jgi:DNA-binding Lrp family transcriptional regulator